MSDVQASMHVPATDVTVQFAGANYRLTMSPRDFTANHFSSGKYIQMTTTRQFGSWFHVGLQGGIDFGHTQLVEEGDILFTNFSAGTSQIVRYTIDYNVKVYNAEPIVMIGTWLPMGRFAWRPYGSIGGGYHLIHETAIFNSVGVDVEMTGKTTTAFGVLGGGGIDFRLWESGAIGFEYQAQRIYAKDTTWTVSLPTFRCMYIF